MTHPNERKICNALKKYGKMVVNEEVPGSEDRLQPVEFFYGVIFDQGILADRAWKAPEKLKQRLGHLDPHKTTRRKCGTTIHARMICRDVSRSSKVLDRRRHLWLPIFL